MVENKESDLTEAEQTMLSTPEEKANGFLKGEIINGVPMI